MKILAINGSPHKNGTTCTALKIMTGKLEASGIGTEIIQIGNKPIQGCIGCGNCRKLGKCRFDDGVNETAEKMKTADGMIISAPTYYGGIAGGAKCFYDRLFYAGANLSCKPATAVTAARRAGTTDVYHQLVSYLTLAGAIITPTVYWNGVFGNSGAEMEQDEEGKSIMENAAASMAWLLQVIRGTKDNLPAPELKKNARTNFIR